MTEQSEGGDGFLPSNDGFEDQLDPMVLVHGGVGVWGSHIRSVLV